jgi:hypothetical protein
MTSHLEGGKLYFYEDRTLLAVTVQSWERIGKVNMGDVDNTAMLINFNAGTRHYFGSLPALTRRDEEWAW